MVKKSKTHGINLYEFFVNGETWKDEEELIQIRSTNAYNALTKLRILFGGGGVS